MTIPEKAVWYGERCMKGHVLKRKEFKLCWDFEYKMSKTNTVRRQDRLWQVVKEKKIWMVDISWSQEKNIEEVTRTKMQKYQQLEFETM